MTTVTTLPIAVIGAGPVGLAAAAHLTLRGFTPVVLEAGTTIGANFESYRHVQLFSPWRYAIDKAAHALLASSGWKAPKADVLPFAGEVIDDYLKPLAALPVLAPHIRLSHRVMHISRAGFDKVKTAGRDDAPFVIRTQTPEGERELRAQAVIDASGTWNQPNPLGASGLPALGETALADHIAYGMPDVLGRERARYAGKSVLVAGAGHSAAGNLLALAQLAMEAPGTRIVWAVRGDNLARVFGGGEKDGLPARGQLGQRLKALQESGRLELHTRFRVHELRREGRGISVYAEELGGRRARIDGIDEIITATGGRPNLEMTRELRLRLDSWLESTERLAPLIDPNEHSCGTVRPHGHRELEHPERGYYAVGARSYGRAPTFLMATGYEQVRSVVAALAGDMTAADDVQLDLPQTGVCSVSFADAGARLAGNNEGERVVPSESNSEISSCCGGPAPTGVDACCVKDADAKTRGESGCGCGSAPKADPQPKAACCG